MMHQLLAETYGCLPWLKIACKVLFFFVSCERIDVSLMLYLLINGGIYEGFRFYTLLSFLNFFFIFGNNFVFSPLFFEEFLFEKFYKDEFTLTSYGH